MQMQFSIFVCNKSIEKAITYWKKKLCTLL